MRIEDLRRLGLSLLTSHEQAQRDTDHIISHVLDQDIAWVMSHVEHAVNAEDASRITSLLRRRGQHEPLAYLLGSQPFYGRSFTVTPEVLIPRPESELIIDRMKTDFARRPLRRAADVGTGSGALAITAALEFPDAQVTAIDTSSAALEVAQSNARRLQASNIRFLHGSLLHPLADGQDLDAIMANLPYLPEEEIKESPTSKELLYEPQEALLAADGGLALIKACAAQAAHKLVAGGNMYLEMLPGQIPLFLAWLMVQGLPYGSSVVQDLAGYNRIVVLTRL